MIRTKIRRNYRNAQGEKLNGVTTILTILNKPALVPWAYKQGIMGVPLYESRDKAADAGTHAHLMVEHHLKGMPEPPTDSLSADVITRAESCYLAYLEWERVHKFEMVESEVELVSERHQYGGTIDIGAIVGDLGIVDIKTSKDIYLENRCQVAAYGNLFNENYQDKIIKGYHILRLGQNGDFSHHYWPNLDREFLIFLHCLEIYGILTNAGWKL